MRMIIKLFAMLVLLPSCGEEHTNFKASLENASTVPIVIMPYKDGKVLSSDTIKLLSGESFQIAHGSHRGKIKTPFFITNVLAIGENDSIVVCFDNQFYVSHYVLSPDSLFNKFYLFESDRNIINTKNYNFIIEKERRLSVYTNHIYTFTEEDYNFAKE